MTSPTPRPAWEQEISAAWTAPPAKAGAYRLHHRLSDTVHGWLDGRHKIPLLPAEPTEQTEQTEQSEPTGPAGPPGPGGSGGPAEPGEPGEPGPMIRIWTPRIKVLAAEAGENIARERESLAEFYARVRTRLGEARAEKRAYAEKIKYADEELGLAREPLPEEEQNTRRLAEQDGQRRPAALVRRRRLAERDRRIAHAQNGYQSAVAGHAEAAETEAALCQIIRARHAAAQAAIWRHHERAQRRIATYLQQLMRSRGKDGPRLNQVIPPEPIGPDLPDWVRGEAWLDTDGDGPGDQPEL